MNTNIFRCLYSGIFFLLLFSAAVASDQLWERSVQLVKSSELMVPGSLVMDQNIVNGKGEIESKSHAVVEVFASPEGLRAEVKSFVENGEDKTSANDFGIEAEINSQIDNFRREIPYHLDNPSQAITGTREGSKIVDGIKCVGYNFEVNESSLSGIHSPYCFRGTVWIDPKTAVPVQIESYMKNLPREEEHAEILSLSQTTNFGYENGSWKRISEQQELWINTKVLFKKIVAVISTHSVYQNHWHFSS